MKFIKENFASIIIIILIAIIMIQRCGNKPLPVIGKDNVISVKSDTSKIDKIIHDTFNTKPNYIVKYIPSKDSILRDSHYLPKKSYDSLYIQYMELAKNHLTEKVYSDTLNINDSSATGKIFINDTVQTNSIKGRLVLLDLKYPIKTITTTVTKRDPPKNQLYFGVGVMGNPNRFVNGGEVNLMLKTKSDIIYDISAKYWNGEIIYGLGTKWKIKL